MLDTHKRGLQATAFTLALVVAGVAVVAGPNCRRPADADTTNMVKPSWEDDGNPVHRALWEAEQDRQRSLRHR